MLRLLSTYLSYGKKGFDLNKTLPMVWKCAENAQNVGQ